MYNSAFGVLNFNLFLCTRCIFEAVFFWGIYYLMSLFVFSIASFCHEAKICDFCSEVSRLYISNTKTMNLQEYSKGALFYILLASLFAATYPDTRQTLGIFHRLEPMRKWLVCCTSILKANDSVGSKRKSNRDFSWHYAFCFYENCYICNVMNTFWRIKGEDTKNLKSRQNNKLGVWLNHWTR